MIVIVMIAALVFQSPANSTPVVGKWQWRGSEPWQRIELNLKANGPLLAGVIRVGPGTEEPTSQADFWEYFVDPAKFDLSNVKIEGNLISFEHSAALNSTTKVRYLYRGVVRGDEILMTRSSPDRQKESWALGTHKVEFLLHRVK